ncbi:MAG: endonuclease/exonuclease/phosphatase family protein [Thermoleophilaceae bacterium]|nr:endonuclease/exonuclease/phosphatase family protein [Thermoleophilaceae bacterium]
MLGRKNSVRRNALALLLTLPWLVMSLVRILSLDYFWPLIPVVAFTPQMLVTFLLPVLIAAVFRARFTVYLLLGLAFVLVSLLLPRAIGNDQPAAEGRVVKIFSANLLAGAAQPGPLLAAIEREDPDIIALQEATPDNFAAIRSAGVLEDRPYFSGVAEFGTRGYITISRWPLKVIPGSGLRGGNWPEMRVVGTGMIFRNIHPPPPLKIDNTPRWRQALSEIPASRGNRVIAGDFNATLDHRDFRAVLGRGYRDAGDQTGNGFNWTWVVTRTGRLVIDHVLVPPGVDVQSFRVIDLPGSDHNALAVRLRLPAP